MNGVTSGIAKDDLDGVLGRFQEWSKLRQGQSQARKNKVDRELPSAKAAFREEANELTYEQALLASRYRRSAALAPVEHFTESAAPNPDSTLVDQKTGPKLDARAEELRPASKSSLKKQLAQPTGKLPGKSSVKDGEVVPTQIRKSQPSSRRSIKASHASPMVSASDLSPALGPVIDLQQKTACLAESISQKSPQPSEFCEVLAGATALSALQAGTFLQSALESKAAVETRSIALSLRVSDAEGARIQMCAAQANLSVSAYLRQCALGVDGLRSQVELALSELRRQEAQPAPPPGISAIPGILSHFAVQWLGKLRRNHEYVGISLR
jgi:hypothetical protein